MRRAYKVCKLLIDIVSGLFHLATPSCISISRYVVSIVVTILLIQSNVYSQNKLGCDFETIERAWDESNADEKIAILNEASLRKDSLYCVSAELIPMFFKYYIAGDNEEVKECIDLLLIFDIKLVGERLHDFHHWLIEYHENKDIERFSNIELLNYVKFLLHATYSPLGAADFIEYIDHGVSEIAVRKRIIEETRCSFPDIELIELIEVGYLDAQKLDSIFVDILTCDYDSIFFSDSLPALLNGVFNDNFMRLESPQKTIFFYRIILYLGLKSDNYDLFSYLHEIGRKWIWQKGN